MSSFSMSVSNTLLAPRDHLNTMANSFAKSATESISASKIMKFVNASIALVTDTNAANINPLYVTLKRFSGVVDVFDLYAKSYLLVSGGAKTVSEKVALVSVILVRGITSLQLAATLQLVDLAALAANIGRIPVVRLVLLVPFNAIATIGLSFDFYNQHNTAQAKVKEANLFENVAALWRLKQLLKSADNRESKPAMQSDYEATVKQTRAQLREVHVSEEIANDIQNVCDSEAEQIVLAGTDISDQRLVRLTTKEEVKQWSWLRDKARTDGLYARITSIADLFTLATIALGLYFAATSVVVLSCGFAAATLGIVGVLYKNRLADQPKAIGEAWAVKNGWRSNVQNALD